MLTVDAGSACRFPGVRSGYITFRAFNFKQLQTLKSRPQHSLHLPVYVRRQSWFAFAVMTLQCQNVTYALTFCNLAARLM